MLPRKPSRYEKLVVNMSRQENRAVEWVDGLDRSILGSFAVTREALIAGYAFFSMAARLESIGSSLTDAAHGLADRYERANGKRPGIPVSSKKTILSNAELWFWWRGDAGNSAMLEYSRSNTDEATEAQVASLELVAAHPEMMHFFTAGIWDVGLISRCMADGVDPSMALSLESRV